MKNFSLQLIDRLNSYDANKKQLNKELNKIRPILLGLIKDLNCTWGYTNYINYFDSNGTLVMYYDKNKGIFYLSKYDIWKVLKIKTGFDCKKINLLCTKILKEHFNCSVILTKETNYKIYNYK